MYAPAGTSPLRDNKQIHSFIVNVFDPDIENVNTVKGEKNTEKVLFPGPH